MTYEVECKLSFPAVPFLKILYLLKTGSSTFSKFKRAFCPCFYTHFQPSNRTARNHALFRSAQQNEQSHVFLEGASGSSCSLFGVFCRNVAWLIFGVLPTMPPVAHWCFTDGLAGFCESCWILHFNASRITFCCQKIKTSTRRDPLENWDVRLPGSFLSILKRNDNSFSK